MTSEAQMEVLSGALDSALRARATVEGGDLSFESVKREINTINRLLDVAVECGMSVGHADLIGWASNKVAGWLCGVGEMA